MGNTDSLRYCTSCGGALPAGARFCASCGVAQAEPQSPSVSETVPVGKGAASGVVGGANSSKRTGLMVLIGVALVAVVVGATALVVSLQSGGDSVGMVVVFEPGPDGYGDVFVVDALGDPYDRDDQVLSDVSMSGQFFEAIAATTWAEREPADLEVDGGRLIVYNAHGTEDFTVGLVDANGGGVWPLVAGRFVTVWRALSGDVLAKVTEVGGGRCEVFRLGGVDDVERLGGGTFCEIAVSGTVLIANGHPAHSDVTVHRPDGTTTGFDARESVAGANFSPDAGMVTLYLGEGPFPHPPIGFQLFDAVSGEFLNELLTPNADKGYVSAVLDSGALVSVTEGEGSEALYSITAGGADRVATGDQVDATGDPSGSRALVRVANRNGAGGVAEYFIWEDTTGTLGDAVAMDPNPDASKNPFQWIDAETALVVEADGTVVGLKPDGDASDVGSVGGSEDVKGRFIYLDNGGLVTLLASGPEGVVSQAVIAPGSNRVVTVMDDSPVLAFGAVSHNGRLFATVAYQETDGRDGVLYVFDVGTEELIPVDEGRFFPLVMFDGEMVIYTVMATRDPDDVETRRFDLKSRAAPEVIYKGAIAHVPQGAAK